jgi:hypothetical protein
MDGQEAFRADLAEHTDTAPTWTRGKQTLRLSTSISGLAWLELAAAAEESTSSPAGARALLAFARELFADDTEYDRFRAIVRAEKLDEAEFQDVLSEITQIALARPTQPSSPSASTSSDTGPASTVNDTPTVAAASSA